MANFVTNAGKGIYTAAVVALAAPPKFAAWGTGSGQTAASTALAAIAAPTVTTAVTGTISAVTTTTTNDTVQVLATITFGSTLAITEAMTTTNATVASGTMTQYGDFTAINGISGDSIDFTFKTVLS
jgi:hypothetical protein